MRQRSGVDFHVGYSPERIDPGNKVFGFVETPKVVAGIDKESLLAVQAVYDDLVQTTVPVSGTREAELTKLLENTFRHVNIALFNELATFTHSLNIDIWESIEAANSKPFGFMKFTPGPGVGGHCLPVDPSYLSWQVKRQLGQNFRFVELANEVNDHMLSYVVERAIQMLNREGRALRGSRIFLGGIAYKRDTGDLRESPALRLIELLNDWGAMVVAADPLVEDHDWPAECERVQLTSEELDNSDLVVLLTPHTEFDLSLLSTTATPVFDTVHAVSGNNVEHL